MGRWIKAAATAAVILLLTVPTARGAALPQISWEGAGAVDWSSGYIIAYGRSTTRPGEGNNARGRSAAVKRAHRTAADFIYRASLELTIQEKLLVRDYLKDDPDRQDDLRRAIREVPPWAVQMKPEGKIFVALRYPLGGTGLSGLLGRIQGWYGEEEWPSGSLPAHREELEEKATGILFIIQSRNFIPALRPRIMGAGGRTILSYEQASEATRKRAAYIPYYTTLAEGMKDPLLEGEPLLIRLQQEHGTDIVIPDDIERRVLATDRGRRILQEGRIVVVQE